MPGPMSAVDSGIRTDYEETGPMAGVTAANKWQAQQDMQGRNFQNNDLAYASELNKYQNDMLDNPMKDAQRLQKLNEAGLQNDMYASGEMKDAAHAKISADIQESLSKKTKGQLDDIQAKAVAAQSWGQGMEDENTPGAAVRNAKFYNDTVLPQAKLMGIKLPEQYGPDALKSLKMAEQRAVFTAPQLQKERDLRIQGENEVAKANVTGQFAVEAATMQGSKAAALSQLNMEPDKELEKIAMAKAADGTLTAEDVTKLKTVYKDKYLSKDPAAVAARASDIAQATVLQSSPKEYAAKMAKEGLGPKAEPSDYADVRANKKADEAATKYVTEKLGATAVAKAMQNKGTTPDPKLGPAAAKLPPQGGKIDPKTGIYHAPDGSTWARPKGAGMIQQPTGSVTGGW